MSFLVGRLKYEIMCVPTLKFKEIKRENGTRGSFYLVWAFNSFRQCFLAQSVPPLLTMVRQVCDRGNLYCSSFYRILRKEAKGCITQGFKIKKMDSLEELNLEISRFELLFVCSQDFHRWVLEESSVKNKCEA